MSAPKLTDDEGAILLGIVQGLPDGGAFTNELVALEARGLVYAGGTKVTFEGQAALRDWVGPDEAHHLANAGLLEAAS